MVIIFTRPAPWMYQRTVEIESSRRSPILKKPDDVMTTSFSTLFSLLVDGSEGRCSPMSQSLLIKKNDRSPSILQKVVPFCKKIPKSVKHFFKTNCKKSI